MAGELDAARRVTVAGMGGVGVGGGGPVAGGLAVGTVASLGHQDCGFYFRTDDWCGR